MRGAGALFLGGFAMRREYKVAALSGAVLITLLAVGPAQSLAGSNTVFSDDIVDGQVKAIDIAANSIGGGRIADGGIGSIDVANNSLTGADINEGTLVMPGPKARFAIIGYSGSVDGGQATSVSHTQTGLYDITFPWPTAGCATTVSAPPGWGAGAVGHAGPYGGNVVRVYFTSGGNFADIPFSLTMICP